MGFMGFIDRFQDGVALQSQIDILLADTAIRVQLTATDYNKVVSRYRTIHDWLERDDSLLRGRVVLLYPQGSVAIGATIASKLRTDEFDIDIIVELDLPAGLDAETVLDLLFESLRGQQGSRYYSMTNRRNRCVTVSYADGMHLDLTPAVLVPQLQPKTSWIFHHKPETPEVPGYRLLANPHGFADWFKAMTPLDHIFAEAFARRAIDAERAMAIDKAEAVPVPTQEGAHEKSKAVIALQLLKRARNVRYESRTKMRRPPSVMMAKLAADAANRTNTLSQEVLHQAQHLHAVIGVAHQQQQLVAIMNPRCDEDCFTDRWPSSLREQKFYLDDLADFIGKVRYLNEGECDLADMQTIMADLFGETPTGAVFKSFAERLGQGIRTGRSFYQPGSSRLDLTKTGVVAPAVVPSARSQQKSTRRHTFYGRPRE